MNPSQNPSALRSKNEITNALLQLMKQYPYHEISVKQIVIEAQIVRKTFYRNYSDKDDVLDAYLNNIMTEYATMLQQIKDCGVTNVLNVVFDFCCLHKEFLLLLYKNHLMYLLLDKLNTFIPNSHEQVINHNSAFYKISHELQINYILAFNIGSIWNIIVMWIAHGMTESPEEIKKTIVSYLSNINSFL